MPELHKAAGERCRYQKAGKGCMIYADRPVQCAMWSCRWLIDPETADLSRPDRSHYVIDVMPDYITVNGMKVAVVQVWIDPDYPEAHRDSALRAYLAKLGEQGCAALIRYNNRDGFTLFPPTIMDDRQWHEIHDGSREKPHTVTDILTTLGVLDEA